MKTYELTLYMHSGDVKIVSCRRMSLREAFDFFYNYLRGDIKSLKMEIYK